MNNTVWAHLPNAKHIDRILSDLKANPGKWETAYAAARETTYDDARKAAHNAARDAANRAALEAAIYDVYDATAFNVAYIVCEAVLALVAYDDCAYLLDKKPEDVKMLALLGNQKAILLYSACVALHKEKELV